MAANSTATPSPYLLSPSGQWDGIDGNWSSFRISIGNPQQDFRVLISTRGNAPWAPAPEACVHSKRSHCTSLRGVQPFYNSPSPGFQQNKSTTWQNLDMHHLALEQNLGYEGVGAFGIDTVHLGYNGDSDVLELNNTLVAGTSSDDFYVGQLGVSSSTSALSAGSPPYNAFITNLKDTGKIPSSSYGYTAGAKYRYKGVPGSLVLGGYDKSRFEPTDLDFTFGDDITRPQLKVGIQGITTNASFVSQSKRSLLPLGDPGPWSYIDSTVPQLWLPKKVCDQFEAAFGLTFNAGPEVYTVNNTMHDKLVAMNPAITFQLGNTNVPDPNSTSITLPYAAFDLWMSSPVSDYSTRYFPIRRSANESQNTIGRVFLQEAYLIVDNERSSFRLSQAKFDEIMPPSDIRSIHPPDTSRPSKHHHGLSAAAKAGISIAAVLAFLLMVAAILFRCWLKPRREASEKKAIIRRRGASIGASSTAPTYREKYDQQPPGYTPAATNHERISNKTVDAWAEMPAQQVERRPELDGTHSLSYELAVTHDEPSPVHEMDGNAGAEGSAAGEGRAADAVGNGAGERTGFKKRGRRASVVPFFA